MIWNYLSRLTHSRVISGTNQVFKMLAKSKGGDFTQLLGLPLEGFNEASETETYALHTARFGGWTGSIKGQTLAQTWEAAGNMRGEVLVTNIGKTIGHHWENGPVLGHRDEVVVPHHSLAKACKMRGTKKQQESILTALCDLFGKKGNGSEWATTICWAPHNY